MGHTSLMRWLVSLAADHAEAGRRRVDLSEVRARTLSRREFLAGAGALGVAACSAPALRLGRERPSLAIIGGGIAGLAAALTLADAGIASTLYDSSDRVGGRMHSDTRGYWNDGQISEWCGELIDSSHRTLLSLAQRFRLPITDLLAAQPAWAEPTCYLFGQYYPKARADFDFKPVHEALQHDLRAAGHPTTFANSTPGGVALDNLSVYEWIESRVPEGHRSPLGRLLDVAYASEYGAATTDLSALNLVYSLGSQANAASPSVFGISDDRYHITGGNQQLPHLIAQTLPEGSIKLAWRMVAVGRGADGRVTLTFDAPGGTRAVGAEHVILALPFAVLRTLDYRGAEFDALKRKAIQELGRGRNAKLHLQFRARYWEQRGPWPGVGNGSSFSDTGYQSTYQVSRGQPGASGLIVNYTGGDPSEAVGASTAHGDAGSDPAVVPRALGFLQELERVWPGISRHWNRKASLSLPALDPDLNCSYSYWRVGQYHTIRGNEGVRDKNIHFAGEHCSVEFQGYMEGAAAEGIRAAKEILVDL